MCVCLTQCQLTRAALRHDHNAASVLDWGPREKEMKDSPALDERGRRSDSGMISPSHQQVRGEIQMHASPLPEADTGYQAGVSLRLIHSPITLSSSKPGSNNVRKILGHLDILGTQPHLNCALFLHFISHLIITQLHNVMILFNICLYRTQSKQ